MDRVTAYSGALIAETDPLKAQQNALIALGWSAQSALGTATAVDGFGLTPTTPSSLVANLAPGAIYQVAATEATVWSSLPANSASVVKQGLMLAVDPITFTPPTGTGFSQAFLVEVQYADLDTNPVLLPYYNAANPAQPYSGPGGGGTSQNTARLGIVAVQVKPGVAVSGTPVIPTPDAGWTGLYVVTLAAGATSVLSGNIAVYSGAPFIPVKLPGVPSGVQSGKWVFASATGANAYSAAFSPALTTRTVGMEVMVYFASPNTTTTPTLNDGLGAAPLVKTTGAAPAAGDIFGFVPLVWDGTNYRSNGPLASDINLAINYLGQIDLLSNGAMEVSQLNGANAVANANGYILDNVQVLKSGSLAVSAQQVSDAPAGYSKSLQVSVTTASSVLGASDYLTVTLPVEGVDLARLNFGTNAAAPFSVGFWFKSSIAGTFCVAPQNFAAARSYVAPFTYATAGAWQWVPLAGLPGDFAGSWVSGAAGSMKLNITLAAGANFQGASGAWTAGNLLASAGQVNGAATSGATFQIAGATLLPGMILPPAANAYLVRRTYQQEYQRCLRYLETGIGGMAGAVPGFTSFAGYKHAFKASKRVVPAILSYSFDGSNCTAYNPGQQATWGSLPTTYTTGTVEVDGIYVKASLSTANVSWAFYLYWTVDARM
jgi:hypothetical protein